MTHSHLVALRGDTQSGLIQMEFWTSTLSAELQGPTLTMTVGARWVALWAGLWQGVFTRCVKIQLSPEENFPRVCLVSHALSNQLGFG